MRRSPLRLVRGTACGARARRIARGGGMACSTTRARGGFTLVELLAALGISLLLIAAVSSALDVYLRVTTTGQEAIERQQITRALFDQMTSDVASVVFRPAAVTEMAVSAPSSAAQTSDGSGSITIQVQDPSSAYTTSSVGLIGDAQTLLLHISRPQGDLQYVVPALAGSLSTRTSDLVSVSYFLAVRGGNGLAGAVAEQQSPLAVVRSAEGGGNSPVLGLARLEGDRMAIDHADLASDTQALAGTATVIAPEIASLQFRYFDGRAWLDAWDSTAMDGLPRAVEVTIGFRDAVAESHRPAALSGIVPIGQTVRHVIHVPLADPGTMTAAGAL